MLTLAVLLLLFGSMVVVLLVTVLTSVCPAVLASIVTVKTKLALAPDARLAAVSVTWLLLLLSVNVVPAVWLCDTNVVPVGSRSLKVTALAACGLELAIVTV